MLFAGKVRENGMGAGRDKDGFGGDGSVALAEMYRLPILERGAGHEAVYAGFLKDPCVDAVQAVDLAPDIADQGSPIELEIVASPTIVLCLRELGRVFAAIDEELLRNAAADHTGAADAVLLGNANLGAELGSKARRANSAGAPTDDELVVIVLSHLASGSCAAQQVHPAAARYDSQIGNAKKQSMLYHAWDPFQREGENLGLGDRAEGAIDDEIALIGDERRIPLSRPELDLAVAT